MPWSYQSIRARDIGAGGGAVWAVGNQDTANGYPIFKLENGVWVQKGEQTAIRIAVGGDGNAWVVNRNGTIYRWNGNSWSEITGVHAVDLSIASDEVWVCNKHSNTVYYLHNGSWHHRPWAGTRIAANSSGTIWHVNYLFRLFRGTKDTNAEWETPPNNEDGVRDVGVNGDNVWVLGKTTATSEGYKVYKRTGVGGQWEGHQAYGIAITAGPNNTAWLVTAHGAIRCYTPS